MGRPKDDGDEFRREADALIHRFRTDGKLDALRAILGRLLSAISAMNLGDIGDWARPTSQGRVGIAGRRVARDAPSAAHGA
jgi:hypothetical protein